MLIQRINLHRARGKDQVKTGGYVSNNCHIADTWQDWSCSSKSLAELCFGGFDFVPTVSNSNVPPYLKIIFEKGLVTCGLASMLQQAPVAAFKSLSLQFSSLPTVIDSNSGAVVKQLPLTPWLWHISSAEQELRPLHLPGSVPDFRGKQPVGTVCAPVIQPRLSLLSKCSCSSCLYPTFSTICSSYSYPSCLYSSPSYFPYYSELLLSSCFVFSSSFSSPRF